MNKFDKLDRTETRTRAGMPATTVRKFESPTTESVAVLFIGSQEIGNVAGVFLDRADAFAACAELIRGGKDARVAQIMLRTPSIIREGEIWLVADSSKHFVAFCSVEAASAYASSFVGGPMRLFTIEPGAAKGVTADDLQKLESAVFRAALSTPKNFFAR